MTAWPLPPEVRGYVQFISSGTWHGLPLPNPVDPPDEGEVTLFLHATTPEGLDLGFLRRLPRDRVVSLSLTRTVRSASMRHLAHFAPGLRRLYLGWTALGDDVLPYVAELWG